MTTKPISYADDLQSLRRLKAEGYTILGLKSDHARGQWIATVAILKPKQAEQKELLWKN